MPACPVCETPHAPGALDCDTCGHIFHMAAVEASVVPLEGFEPTLEASVAVTASLDPDLEPTAQAPVAAVPTEIVEGFEATIGPSAPELAGEDTPGLEPTRATDEDLPSALPSQIRCRYCGSEGQKEGRFCDTCGMRLPRLADDGGGPAGDGILEVICQSCGSRLFADRRCLGCGVLRPSTT